MDVVDLVSKVHLPTNGAGFHGHLALLIGLGHFFQQLQLALALAPAAVVEREKDVSFFHEHRRHASRRAFLRSAGPGDENDHRKFRIRCQARRQIQVAGHLRPITPDRDRTPLDRAGQRGVSATMASARVLPCWANAAGANALIAMMISRVFVCFIGKRTSGGDVGYFSFSGSRAALPLWMYSSRVTKPSLVASYFVKRCPMTDRVNQIDERIAIFLRR